MYDADPTLAIRTTRRFNLISASLAFILWSVWAYLANRGDSGANGGAPPIVSGVVQGIGSFCFTLLMVRIVTWLYHRLRNYPLNLVLPALLTAAFTGTGLFIAHSIAGTANVFRTIAPALVVAFGFNLFTTFKLRNAEKAVNHHGVEDEARVKD